VKVGDYFELLLSGTMVEELKKISGITNNSLIGLESAYTGGNLTLTTDYDDYRIHRSLKVEKPYSCDFTVCRGELIFFSPTGPPTVFNETSDTVEEYVTPTTLYPSTGRFFAAAGEFFLDRLWVANLIDGTDGDRRQRIRWSTITNARDFSTATAYYDLPYSSGEILRILGMGRTLMCYLNDAVYMGTETRVPLLPISFQKIETGGRGLVGPKAVIPWLDGHFAVLSDDIYYISTAGAEPIGTPIIRDVLNNCSEPWRIYAVIDPTRYRVCFGFPASGIEMTKLFSYAYRTQAWSYDEVDTQMVSNPIVNLFLEWRDLVAPWSSLGSYTWEELSTLDPIRTIYVEKDSSLWKLSKAGATDFGSGGIPVEAITPDWDGGQADAIKLATRMSIKLMFPNGYPGEHIEFTVMGSTNKGRSYRPLGTLVVKKGYDEGYLDFKISGSTLRFKLVSTTEVEPYYITEMVIRVAGGGEEVSLDMQTS
jgi:hypothetical protein